MADTEKIAESILIVKFVAPGSVIFELHVENIIPMQLVAVGEYLRHKGLVAMDFQERKMIEEQEKNKIAVPNLIQR